MQTKPTTKAKATERRSRAVKGLPEFGADPAHRPLMADLYRQAKAQLRKQPQSPKSKPRLPNPGADPQRLLHELQVHQVELELQNEELRRTRDAMEAGLEKYSDLYDFAPVGYLTLDREGTIAEANLAGASLLGVGRAALVKRRFGTFVSPADRSVFAAFLLLVFKSKAREECAVTLLVNGKAPAAVRMRAIVSSSGQACRVAMTDITEHKQAEEIMRRSEIRYRRLFEAAHDGVLLLDPGTRKITDANPFMTRLLGYPNEELVGKELFEIGLLKDEAASQQMFRKLKQKHEVRYEDLPLESQDGRHQEVEVVANLYQENGHAVIQCNIRDITERKLADEALRQGEERYRTLFNSMDQGYCIIELIFDQHRQPVDWRFLEVNPSFEKHNGLHDATGRLISELAPDLEASWFAIYGKVAATGKPVRFENLSKSLGGQWFDLYAFRVGGPDSRKVAVLFSNITARKNTEQELSEKARLLDLSHDAIIVRDVKGRIRYWNHGAEELYGWSREEALGKFCHRLLRTEFPTPFKQITRELRRRNRWIGELVHRKRDGRRVTVLVRKTLDRDPEGRPASVLDNITDITARKEAETATRRVAVLAASNEKLEREIVRRRKVEASLKKSEQRQGRLLEQSRQMQAQLRGLSHQILLAQEEERKRISRELHDDVTQTLVSINVQLESLTKAAEISAALLRRKILRARRLVEKSVNIVHEFARELRPPALDHLGLISALHSFMKDFMKRTGIRVRFTTFAEVEKLNSTRCTVLYRVIQSALTNIAQHAHASRAEVNLQKRHRHVSLTVQDDGRSFDVARALSGKKSRRLGLIGMRERVEMVGGKFVITSAPGKGTTITAEIPFASGHGEPGGGAHKRRRNRDRSPAGFSAQAGWQARRHLVPGGTNLD